MTSSKPPIMNKLKSATARLGWIGPIGYSNRMSPARCKYLGKTKDSFVCNLEVYTDIITVYALQVCVCDY